MRAHTSQGVNGFVQPMIGWMRINAPPKPRRPSVIGWDAWNGEPDRLDPAYPHQNGSPFPPEVILGGFLFGDDPPEAARSDLVAASR